jgi:hypothetical protein
MTQKGGYVKRLRSALLWGIAAAFSAASAFSQSLDPSAALQTVRNAQGQLIQYGSSYQSDVSLPLAYIADGEPETSADDRDAAENWQPIRPHTNGKDTTVQDYFYSFAPQSAMPAPLKTFDGMTGAACGCAPPDTDGEVGKTQYVQMTNSGFQVFDKGTGNSVLGPKSTASIWSGFGGVCENNGKGDPIILYDQLADRWVISQFAGNYPTTAITDQCIAVSTTGDATGSYHRYGFHLGSDFFDYPHMGMWPDGYYLSDNVFAWNGSPGNYERPQPFAFDRVSMINGATTVNFVTNSTVLGANDPPILPADLDGMTLPPNGAQELFVEYPDNGTYRVYRMHPDYATPANTTFALVPNPPATATFSDTLCNNASNQGRACVPTSAGSSNYVDSLMGRLMFRLAYRNFGDHESLLGNFTVGSNNVTGIRWFELRNVTAGTPTVYQESTYQPDTTWRWMGSVAMDQQGNVALGYSASSSSTNPQIRYAGRLVNDPVGTLAQTEAHLFDGPGAQSGASNRWGDYSDMTVDPVDDCTFWYTQEYSPSGGGSWQSRIGNFKFPGCSSAPDFSISIAPASEAVCAPGTTTYTVSIGQLAGFTNPVTLSATGLPSGVTASFNPATVTPGSSAVTSTLTLTVSNTASAATSNITVNGAASGSQGHSTTAGLTVTTGVPTAATLSAPASGATGVATAPTFTWTAGSNTTSYTLEVATDSGFSNIVKSVPNLTATTTGVTGLATNTTYYWHVKSINGCGSTTSVVSSFTTANVVAPLCSSPAKSIPLSDSITVTDTSQLASLQVQIQSTYSWTGDLKFTLSNASSSDVLINRPGVAQGLNGGFGCGTGNINVTLDDTGTTVVDNQCNSAAPAQSGTDKPSSPIGAAFANKSFAGTWTLQVAQAGSFALGSGTLDKWCLVPTLAAPTTYKVGGNVSGLSSTGLVLSLNNGAQTQAVSANGAFNFATGLSNGASYAVTVGTQPSGQSCTVSNGSGTIASANVTNVGVSCTNTTTNFTVTPSVSGGNGTISPSTAQTVASGATTTFTLTPSAGYHTVTPVGGTCAVGSLSGNTYTTGAITANCTVIGSFAITTYTVTASAGSNGSITPASQTVNSGSTASFTVTPNAGYHVASVSGDTCTVTPGSGSTWTTNAITQNCAVNATFAITTYTVTASAGSNGSITPASQTVNSGSTASLTVTPNAGYHVASVSGDTCTVTQGSGSTWTTNAITQNCAVNATFAITTYTVTASASGNGSITPASQTVNSGSTASFTVNANPRHHVASVSGDTCTVTHGSGSTWTTNAINANCAVTATFALNKLVFTTQPVNVNQGNVLGTVTVTEQDDNGATMDDNATVVTFTTNTACGALTLGTATMVNGVATLASTQRFYTAASNLTVSGSEGSNTLAAANSSSFSVMGNADMVYANGLESCRP